MMTHQDSRRSPEMTRQPGGRVLVVEDDPILRRVLVKILQSWGFAILEATDGLSALETIDAKADELSVILLDIMLPLLNGLEVARRVGEERPEVPIVACSAALTDDLRADLHDAGVRVFLPKPYSADLLRATLCQAARRLDTASDAPATS